MTSTIQGDILAYFFLRERLTIRMILGSLIAVLGVYMLVSFGKPHVSVGLGDVLAFGAMLAFAVSIIFVRKLSQTLESASITVYSTVLGAGMFLSSLQKRMVTAVESEKSVLGA